MKTTVVNRRLETEDVYIGRGSPFGNPFIAHNTPSKFGGVVTVKDTAEAISRYREWLTSKEEIPGWKKPTFEEIWALRGQRLGCFCKGGDRPVACHGDVLVELIEAMEENDGPERLAAGLADYARDQAELIEQITDQANDDLRAQEIRQLETACDDLEDAVARAERARDHHCHAIGCDFPVPPEMLMCHRHWYMVPKRHRDAVWAAYRPGQCDDMRPSAAWFIAAEKAITSVAVREGKITAAEAEARVAKEVARYGAQAKADAEAEAKRHEEWLEKLRAMGPNSGDPADDDVPF